MHFILHLFSFSGGIADIHGHEKISAAVMQMLALYHNKVCFIYNSISGANAEAQLLYPTWQNQHLSSTYSDIYFKMIC
ncbi:hypothetical protein XENTR_v10021761 [Xenopus tropicalis]|nr:hypothetical protein XENTR_v10021761 [Xenopus tropicalis]